jgi:hypothetical protein
MVAEPWGKVTETLRTAAKLPKTLEQEVRVAAATVAGGERGRAGVVGAVCMLDCAERGCEGWVAQIPFGDDRKKG